MAVPYSRNSRTRVKKRRANQKIAIPKIVVCDNCGSYRKTHNICKSCGFYKNKQIVKGKDE